MPDLSGPRANAKTAEDDICRILSLDGGGAKGFYTIGVLREIEGLIGCSLHERFDLIFGTSTGAIIAALLGVGKSVKDVNALYEEYVPTVMSCKSRASKSAALAHLGKAVFGEMKFDAMKTGVGIVATRWVIERPMIFKTSIEQAHGRAGLDSGAKRNVLKRSGFECPFQARQSRLGMAS
jgi:hypothetical protein